MSIVLFIHICNKFTLFDGKGGIAVASGGWWRDTKTNSEKVKLKRELGLSTKTHAQTHRNESYNKYKNHLTLHQLWHEIK